MIDTNFALADWIVFFLYFFLLAFSSYVFSKMNIKTSREFFVAKNSIPMLGAAISIVATSQSAATFLGAPEYSYRGDFSFIGFYISAFLAVVFVSYVFIPRFYAIKAVTVYELLEKRYDAKAKKQAGVMFLVGRVLASGARLYIGALAISMILFNDTSFLHVTLSSTILLFGALLYTYFGGIKSIVFSDIIQFIIYVGAGVIVAIYLLGALDMGIVESFHALDEADKLNFIDTSFDGKFGIPALLSGWLLLNIAAFGLDQDMTQRVLSCKNKNEATSSLVVFILLSIPVVLLFLFIGALLSLLYKGGGVIQIINGESVSIFMYYILNELPEGLKGLVTVGAIAAALSSTNSVLGAMASVAVEDIYKPYKLKHGEVDEEHFLKASRIAVILFSVVLWVMSIVSYLWQHNSDIPLISFALGVMAFAYSGLLGVYFSAVFTKTKSASRVPYALVGGFLSVLAMQPYVFDIHIGFAYQITIATAVSFAIMHIGIKNG